MKKNLDTLVDVTLERALTHKGMVSDMVITQVTEQLEWIKTNYSDDLPKSELPNFNLDRMNVGCFDDLDPTLAAMIHSILKKIGFYEEDQKRLKEKYSNKSSDPT